jgi:putative transposase
MVLSAAMDPLDLIAQGKIQRYFRASRKLNVPKLVFHITQRAVAKELLFIEDSDYLHMIWLLKEIAINYSLRIYAFCLMPNHIHLLLSPNDANLHDAMRDLFSRYAVRFNRKYERKGHLFGGPYRQAICFDDTYLVAASVYIHSNPVRANLITDPLQYRWSSCRLYCMDDAPESFLDIFFILKLLAEDNFESKKSYRLLVKLGCDTEAGNLIEEEDTVERFCSELSSVFAGICKRAKRKKPVAAAFGREVLDLQELEKYIEEVKNKGTERAPETREAKKFLIEQLMARGFKRKEIAERLGVSRKTIYNILKSS